MRFRPPETRRRDGPGNDSWEQLLRGPAERLESRQGGGGQFKQNNDQQERKNGRNDSLLQDPGQLLSTTQLLKPWPRSRRLDRAIAVPEILGRLLPGVFVLVTLRRRVYEPLRCRQEDWSR